MGHRKAWQELTPQAETEKQLSSAPVMKIFTTLTTKASKPAEVT